MIDDDTLIVGEWMTGSAKRIKILKSKTESMLEKNKYFSTPNFTAKRHETVYVKAIAIYLFYRSFFSLRSFIIKLIKLHQRNIKNDKAHTLFFF